MWHRLDLRSLETGGAVVESAYPYQTGTSLRIRVSLHGRSVEMRTEVRSVAAAPPAGGEMRYLLRLRIAGDSPEVGEWLNEFAAEDRQPHAAGAAAADPRMEVPVDATVALRDLSLGGAMFTSATELSRGATAQLTARLGAQSFVAEVQVLRVETQPSPQRSGYRIGASFVSMDEASRQHLAAFLMTAET